MEDQLALAGWCKKAGLLDQWRAHLGNVLTLNPDHQEARARCWATNGSTASG